MPSRQQARATGDAGEGGAAGVVRVGPNRPLFALTGALSLVLAAGFLVCLFVYPAAFLGRSSWGESLEALLVSLGSVLVYGGWARFHLGALLPGRAVVVLDDEGIRDRSSQFTADVVRWEEMTSVSISGSGPFRVLCIRVRDPEALLARQRPLVRFLLGLGCWNAGSRGTPLGVAQVNVGVPLERLQEQIEARLARHQNERRWWTQQG